MADADLSHPLVGTLPAPSTGEASAPAVGARSANEAVISVRGLRVSYGDFEAVRGIDLEVFRGEVFAFLGPNGAGKTTTVQHLEGYLRRTAGEVSVLGLDPEHPDADWRARMGVVLQESAVEPDLTVRECVKLYAGYYGCPTDVDQLIERVGLKARSNARGGTLSGGERRRLDVALSLVGDPELIFLDEPTTGFDPSARRAAWEMIGGLQELGKTIFLTTHYMEEAEYLADQICVLTAGRIVGEGSPQTLGGRDRARSEISFTWPPGSGEADLPPALLATLTDEHHGRAELRTDTPMAVLGELAAWAGEHGYALDDIEVHRPTLEEIYLQLTEGSA